MQKALLTILFNLIGNFLLFLQKFVYIEKTMSQRKKDIRIVNVKDFEETINSKKRVEKVLAELQGDLEIHNSIVAVNYSDEGFATFEIIMNKEEFMILCFIGTAC